MYIYTYILANNGLQLISNYIQRSGSFSTAYILERSKIVIIQLSQELNNGFISK